MSRAIPGAVRPVDVGGVTATVTPVISPYGRCQARTYSRAPQH